MLLKRIDIENFACFKNFHADFVPGVNIVIGRNGAGKSSLIKSLVYLMNFMFTNDKSMGNDYLSAGNPDLKMNSVKPYEFYRNHEQSEVATHCNLHGILTFMNENIEWDMYKKSTSGASLYPSKYVDAYRQIMRISKYRNKLPVLAYFSDSFPHKNSNISTFAKNEINNTNGILKNFGYYMWDNDSSCVTIWQLRLVNVMARNLSLNEKESNARKEVEYITDTLIKFSEPINENSDDSYKIEKVFFTFDSGTTPELWLKLKSGFEIPFNSLPAGYLRLYGIVLELAYRTYLLNRNNTELAVGLVLIDEIDLHLHPSLEMEVIERFRKVFPSLQFIVTTHSPLVITSVKADGKESQILRLVANEEEPHVLPDLYGIDYNAGLMDGMEVHPSNEDVDYVKRGIIRALRKGNLSLAITKKKELAKMVSQTRFESICQEINECITQKP